MNCSWSGAKPRSPPRLQLSSPFPTDPQEILSSMGRSGTDAHPGGLYLVKDIAGRPGRTARGQFREVVPVHRLAYSFGWDGDKQVLRAQAWSRSTFRTGTAARWCA